jgi:hypothetical protein
MVIASGASAGAYAVDQPRVITNANANAVVSSAAPGPAACVTVGASGGQLAVVIPGTPVAPAAVVSRELSLQPTYDRLATVQVGDTNTIIDPYADLRRTDAPCGLDENNSLLQAQRQWLSLSAPPAPRVIVGAEGSSGATAEAQPDPSFVHAPPALPAPARTAAPRVTAQAAPPTTQPAPAAKLAAK